MSSVVKSGVGVSVVVIVSTGVDVGIGVGVGVGVGLGADMDFCVPVGARPSSCVVVGLVVLSVAVVLGVSTNYI